MPKGDFEALAVLEHIIGSHDTSPIYKDLVMEQKLALDVGISGVGYSVDDHYINISATLSPDQCLVKIRQKLRSTIGTFIKNALNEGHIKQAKKEILNEQAFLQDSRARIRFLFADLAYGLSASDIITADERINAVTLEQVKKAYGRYLDKKPSVVLHLAPPKKEQSQSGASKINDENPSFFHRLKSLFTSTP
jgi:zinc protease